MDHFAHLHLHSRASFWDGLHPIEELVARAVELGQPGIALTDHGVMYGAAALFKTAKHQPGFTPVIGMEAYEAVPHEYIDERDGQVFKTKWADLNGQMRYFHLTLWAMNNVGYQNLVALHTKSFHRDHKPKNQPLIDRAMLEQHSEGIMVGLGCPQSRVNVALAQNNLDHRAAYDDAKWYANVFPGRVYVEVMGNLAEQLALVNPQRKLAKMIGATTIATNDVHYLRREDGVVNGPHHILVQGRRHKKADTDESSDRSDEGYGQWYGSDGFYLKSAAEMHAMGGISGDEIERTLEVLGRVDFNFYKERRRPEPPLPLIPAPGELPDFDSWQGRLSHESLYPPDEREVSVAT